MRLFVLVRHGQSEGNVAAESAQRDRLERIAGRLRSRGRLSDADLDATVPDWRSRAAYVCGPAGMLDAATDLWHAHDVPDHVGAVYRMPNETAQRLTGVVLHRLSATGLLPSLEVPRFKEWFIDYLQANAREVAGGGDGCPDDPGEAACQGRAPARHADTGVLTVFRA